MAKQDFIQNNILTDDEVSVPFQNTFYKFDIEHILQLCCYELVLPFSNCIGIYPN